MKSCPNCNSQNADDSKFCAKCGYEYRVVYSEGEDFKQEEFVSPLMQKIYSNDVIDAKINFKPELVITIIFGIMGLIGVIGMGDFKTSMQCLFSLVILIGLFWIRPAIINSTTKLSVKKDIVIGKTGLINSRKMTSKLTQIQNITVDKTFFGRIFGYSTISITTTTGEYDFKRIKNADEVQTAINKQIELNKKIEMEDHAKALAKAMANEINK